MTNMTLDALVEHRNECYEYLFEFKNLEKIHEWCRLDKAEGINSQAEKCSQFTAVYQDYTNKMQDSNFDCESYGVKEKLADIFPDWVND